ncbi:HNH endonuclease [Robertmurraya siralis]|uniref:HNH endonuclease n=1 Tax=Robertmurraya siralis TaxID=77777 RepID=UPI0010F94035|nr:HNH endonuclease [Robertmurraya siralis]
MLYKICNIKTKKERKLKIPYEINHKYISGIEHKNCNDCNEWLPMTNEHFYKNSKNNIDGFNPYCKKCTSIRSMEWQNENKDKRRGYQKKYYDNDEERKEQIRKSGRTRWANGKRSKWVKETNYNYQKFNQSHDISKEEWENCKKYFNYSCAYCGLSEEKHREIANQDLHKEHVDHLGSNDLSNCVPSCRKCNSSKWAKLFEEWYTNENPIYDDMRYYRILKWLEEDYKLK